MLRAVAKRLFAFCRDFSVVLRPIPLHPQNSPYGFKQLRLQRSISQERQSKISDAAQRVRQQLLQYVVNYA